MTKPQLSAEPSMEDILASIRKMISEERMGPRPIPDQMSRTSYGESSPAARSAAPAADRFGRAPGEGAAARPTAERAQPERSAPERTGQERSPIDRGAAERS